MATLTKQEESIYGHSSSVKIPESCLDSFTLRHLFMGAFYPYAAVFVVI